VPHDTEFNEAGRDTSSRDGRTHRALLPSGPPAPGRLSILACPGAICPHLEFAVATVLETPVSLIWTAQPERVGTLCAELEYVAPAGTAEALVARLRSLNVVTFEVIEGSVAGADAHRYCFDPDLGIHHAALASNGDVVIAEGPLRALLGRSRDGVAVAQGLSQLLGDAWDTVLDPLRVGGDGAPVSWLRRTG
jgi:hypothetical protein